MECSGNGDSLGAVLYKMAPHAERPQQNAAPGHGMPNGRALTLPRKCDAMSYVQTVLQPGEVVRHIAGLHWSRYLPGLLVCVIAGIVALLRPNADVHWTANRGVVILAWLCFAVGLALLLQAWFRWWTTEIAVTDRRVIYKTGFIRRNTTEMHMDKVESVEVKQSILGRLLDYGDVEIRGVGTGFEPLRMIDRPLELRNHITAV
jgi:hypothetical protein